VKGIEILLILLLWLIPFLIAVPAILIQLKLAKTSGKVSILLKIMSKIAVPIPKVSLLYLSICMCLAAVFCWLIKNIFTCHSMSFIWYLYISVFGFIALLGEYLAPYFEYLYLKKIHQNTKVDLQGDLKWCIQGFIAHYIFNFFRNIPIRFGIYVAAFFLAFVSACIKFEILRINITGIDVITIIDRVIVTFIASERAIKYFCDRWLNKSSEIKKIKNNREQRPKKYTETIKDCFVKKEPPSLNSENM
jgi:hypothetical protein